jgi:hypothetical protein
MVGGGREMEGWSERGDRVEGRSVSREAGKQDDLGKAGMREDCKGGRQGRGKKLMEERHGKGMDLWREEAGKRVEWLGGGRERGGSEREDRLEGKAEKRERGTNR